MDGASWHHSSWTAPGDELAAQIIHTLLVEVHCCRVDWMMMMTKREQQESQRREKQSGTRGAYLGAGGHTASSAAHLVIRLHNALHIIIITPLETM